MAGGAKITLLSQWLRFAIQVTGLVVLARLLTPTDFGIAAMVTTIVAFAAMFADFGLSLAGIQAKRLTDPQRTNLFWLNAAAGVGGALIVVGAGPLLAQFYGQPEVVGLSVALASSLLLSGLYVQFRVEINRQGRFGVLALQDVLSSAIGLLAAVAAALAGARYWALAIQLIVQALVVLALAVTQAHWFPGKPQREGRVRELLTFGGHNLLLQTVNLASRTVDSMMVGREQGADTLGLYSRAQQVVALAFQQLVAPLTRVVMPRLSHQPDDVFEQMLIRLQRVICYSLPAILSLVFVMASPGIEIVFGVEWEPMSVLVQALAVGAVFQSIGYIYYWALLARAQTRLLVWTEFPGRIFMIVGSILVARYGAVWVALVISLGQIVIFASSSIIVRKARIPSAVLLRSSAVPVGVYTLAAVAGYLVVTVTDHLIAIEKLGLGVSAWICVVGVLALAFPTVRRSIRSAVEDVRRIR